MVNGNSPLSLPGHTGGHGGDGKGVCCAITDQNGRIAIFKDQEPGTDWLVEHRQRYDWSSTVTSEL